MSTRATYQFGKITFYIHYDGYLEGAAQYFWNMHHCANQRSGLAGMFFRANDLAEFTTSHRDHGDSDFRYTLIKDTLKVEARDTKNESYNIEVWKTIFAGHYSEFINQYGKPQEIYRDGRHCGTLGVKDWEPIKFVPCGTYGRHAYLTRTQAQTLLDAAKLSLENYIQKWGMDSGNGRVHQEDVEALEKAVQILNGANFAATEMQASA